MEFIGGMEVFNQGFVYINIWRAVWGQYEVIYEVSLMDIVRRAGGITGGRGHIYIFVGVFVGVWRYSGK